MCDNAFLGIIKFKKIIQGVSPKVVWKSIVLKFPISHFIDPFDINENTTSQESQIYIVKPILVLFLYDRNKILSVSLSCSTTSNSSPNTPPHGLHAVSCPPGSKTKCLPWSLAVGDNVLGFKMCYVSGSVNIILLKVSDLRLGICM